VFGSEPPLDGSHGALSDFPNAAVRAGYQTLRIVLGAAPFGLLQRSLFLAASLEETSGIVSWRLQAHCLTKSARLESVGYRELKKMRWRALIFDIGGTVFDWSTALEDALDVVLSRHAEVDVDPSAFAHDCREAFLNLCGAVARQEIAFQTSDEMLAHITVEQWERRGLPTLRGAERIVLATSWRAMRAWPGAPEAISTLRKRYIAAPLTILSCPIAVGSSRASGIDWDCILSCDILGLYKPDPQIFEKAVAVLDCRPEEIAMVASHPSDLRAAARVGFGTVYVLPHLEDPGEDYAEPGLATEFDVVANDFPDLARKLMS